MTLRMIGIAGPFNRVFSDPQPSSPQVHEYTYGGQVSMDEGMEVDRGSAGEEDGLMGKVVGKGWMGELDG